MGRRKGKKYIVRWLEEHPQIRLYLSRDDYEFLKKICDDNGISFRELLLKTIKDMRRVEEVIKKEVTREVMEKVISYLKGDYYEEAFSKDFEKILEKLGVISIRIVGQGFDNTWYFKLYE